MAEINETRELYRHIISEIDEREVIETADLMDMLTSDLLSDLGKANLAISLLRQCGRADLADMVAKETR